LKASVMRLHINSPDYAVHSYNLDNVTDDFDLVHFDSDLTYDSQRVLPLARLALAKAAAGGGAPLKRFVSFFARQQHGRAQRSCALTPPPPHTLALHNQGSPWSPPGWMKTNDAMINSNAVCLKNDTAAGSYIQTWARYVAKWVVAMEAHLNVSFWGITPQNEPEARQAHFESCAYDVPHYVAWVGQHLGPAMAEAAPHVKILAYDHNKLDSLKFIEGVAGDPAAAAAWGGVSLARTPK